MPRILLHALSVFACCLLLCCSPSPAFASGGQKPAASLVVQRCTLHNTRIKAASGKYLPGLDWRLYKAQLIAESNCDPLAESPAGAQGIAQFMPATWQQTRQELSLPRWATPFDAEFAIESGAYHMAKQRAIWHMDRSEYDRHSLALASYNAGAGHLIQAQKLANGAVQYAPIAQHLPTVTGDDAIETTNYVAKVWSNADLLLNAAGQAVGGNAGIVLGALSKLASRSRNTAKAVQQALAEKQQEQNRIDQMRAAIQQLNHKQQELTRNAEDEIMRHSSALNRCHVPAGVVGVLNATKTGAGDPHPSGYWTHPSTPTTYTCTNLAIDAARCESDNRAMRLRLQGAVQWQAITSGAKQ